MGSKPDMASLGEAGFRLVTAGNRLCIIGGRSRGTLYGVYELLERHWGCRWYASFHSVIPRHDALTLSPLDDTQPSSCKRDRTNCELIADLSRSFPYFAVLNKVLLDVTGGEV